MPLRSACLLLAALCAVPAFAGSPVGPRPEAAPATPFRVWGDSYYVGSRRASALMVRTGDGLVLLDPAATGPAGQVQANLRRLGFDLRDVRRILVTRVRPGEAAVLARLQALSGAEVVAGASAARTLPLRVLRIVADGEVVMQGGVAFAAWTTPDAGAAGTSWTWRSCERGDCRDIAFADAPRGATVRVDDARASAAVHAGLATVAGLPCDILLTPHPRDSATWRRQRARSRGVRPDPMLDAHACRGYATAAAARLRPPQGTTALARE